MQRKHLIGLIAGLIATLGFASVATTPSAALLVLAIFTPLPIFLAGLSAGWQSAAIAGATGALAMTFFANPLTGIAFAATQLIPAVVICYFAQLYRELTPDTNAPIPAPKNSPKDAHKDDRDWYPIGWIVLWATAFAILLSIAALAVLAQDLDSLKAMLREQLDMLIDARLPKDSSDATAKTISETDRAYMSEVTLYLLPAATSITLLFSLLLNLWLAGRIARSFNILNRPWPDIAAMTFPQGTPLALTASLVAAWTLTGVPGLAASAVAGGLFFAYALLGLAIVHHITRGMEFRSFALIALYLSLIIFNSAFIILIVLIGLAEPISPLRRDFIQSPVNPSNNED